MRAASLTGQFRRDVKLAQKRGRDMSKFKLVAALLLEGAPLPREFGNHPLKGEWKDCRDLHITPDWVLIYRIDGEEVRFERMGTHSDLFGR